MEEEVLWAPAQREQDGRHRRRRGLWRERRRERDEQRKKKSGVEQRSQAALEMETTNNLKKERSENINAEYVFIGNTLTHLPINDINQRESTHDTNINMFNARTTVVPARINDGTHFKDNKKEKIHLCFANTNSRSLWKKIDSLIDNFKELELGLCVVTETWFYLSLIHI